MGDTRCYETKTFPVSWGLGGQRSPEPARSAVPREVNAANGRVGGWLPLKAVFYRGSWPPLIDGTLGARQGSTSGFQPSGPVFLQETVAALVPGPFKADVVQAVSPPDIPTLPSSLGKPRGLLWSPAVSAGEERLPLG